VDFDIGFVTKADALRAMLLLVFLIGDAFARAPVYWKG